VEPERSGRRIGLGAWLVALTFAAAPAAAQSLEQELTGLLHEHPQILGAEKQAEAAAYEVDKARALYWPRASATGDFGPEFVDSPSTRSRDLEPDSFARTGFSGTVTVTQNLFDGFRTQSAVSLARLNREISAFTAEGTRQSTILEGVRAYVNVLRQRRLVELAQANEENVQIQLNLEDERVQRGAGITVDVLQAKSRLQISKERRVNFQGGLIDATSVYTQVFNHPPMIDDMSDPSPPVVFLPSELDEALVIVLEENPAVANSEAAIAAARERQRALRAEYLPRFDLVGSTNYEKHRGAVIGTRRDYSVLLQATWDLFSGFSTRSSLAQAAFQHGAAQENQRFVMRKVMEQTRISWQALITLRERLQLLENAMNIASEVFESRRALREAGKETVINVLDAESEIFNARINYTAAAYDERLAAYQILLAMGRLTPIALGLGDE